MNNESDRDKAWLMRRGDNRTDLNQVLLGGRPLHSFDVGLARATQSQLGLV